MDAILLLSRLFFAFLPLYIKGYIRVYFCFSLMNLYLSPLYNPVYQKYFIS